MFEYFPGVTSLAIGIMIWQLYVRKNNKEISEDQFKELLVKHTGEKIIKITAIMALLSIPGLNIATASYLIYRFVSDLNSIKNILVLTKLLSNNSVKLPKPPPISIIFLILFLSICVRSLSSWYI